MAFFDLHTHPSFKSSLLNDNVDLCKNPIGFVDIELSVPFGACVEKLVGNSLDSQSSFGQVAGGSLIAVSFIAFERVYAFVSDLKKIKNLGPNILPDMQNQKESYFDRLIKRDLQHFLTFEDVPETDLAPRTYKLLQHIGEYPNQPDPNTVYVVASIEGVHNFYGEKDIALQESDPQGIVNKLVSWKRDSFSNPDKFPRLFYITLAHHGQNVLTNHAWAIPARFAHDLVRVGSFDPTGNGLSPMGETFVRTALRETANEKRILVDIKHLSLKARQQVYALMESDFAGVPILATHMGMTGTSWDNPAIETVNGMPGRPKNLVVSYRGVRGFLRRVSPSTPSPLSALTCMPFNPWSINLYNEDIVQIMRSGGLIGVSLDRRIVGATLTPKSILEPFPVENERFSRLDFPIAWQSSMGAPVSLYPDSALPRDFDGDHDRVTTDSWAFCQQVIHIVLITELHKLPATDPSMRVPSSIDPWDHICLGSDYDGLITALKTCPSARQLSQLFRDNLKACLTSMAQQLNTHHGIANLIRVPNDVVKRLSVQNGLDFLRRHFS